MSARLFLVSAALCGLGAVSLAGCASSGSTSSATSELRADVLAVSRAVAAHDDGAALSHLQTLKGDLAQAKANGRVSAARYSQITAAIDEVSADMAAGSSTSDTPSSTAHASPTHTTARPAPATTSSPAPTVSAAKPPGQGKPTKSKDPGGKGHGGGP